MPGIEALPDFVRSLGAKRRQKIMDMANDERHDAAMVVITIGIKGMYQVHHWGIWRLAELAKAWGPAINRYYDERGMDDPYCVDLPSSGDLVTDPLTLLEDLSDRRKRQVMAWLAEERRQAQANAYAIGQETIRKVCGFGDLRMDKLNAQWLRDVREFYADRETAEPMLLDWIHGIGFNITNFREENLRTYLDDNGKIVRKLDAERIMAREEAKQK